jgi:hypothetical protein
MHDDNCSDQMRNCNQGVKVKPATYDGVNSWIDYKSHFNKLNSPLSLRGSVSAIENDSISEDFVLAKGTLGFVPIIIVCPVSSDDVFGPCTALVSW